MTNSSTNLYRVRWTPEEDAIILVNKRLTSVELHHMLPHRSERALRSRRQTLLATPERRRQLRELADVAAKETRKSVRPGYRAHTQWSDHELNVVRLTQHYRIAEVALMLERSYGAVAAKRFQLRHHR